MATLTRSAPTSSGPAYKDYVNFLGNYKNGKRDDVPENQKSVVSVQHSSDTTDSPKATCIPYNEFLENSKNNRFKPVSKPATENKTTKRSELFIEIQPSKSVSEVAKIFQPKRDVQSPPNAISAKISAFEKQAPTQCRKKQEKPTVRQSPPLPRTCHEEPPLRNVPAKQDHPEGPPPPPPPMPSLLVKKSEPTVSVVPKKTVQQGAHPNEIDRNDPAVKKLVYGTLRGLYGSYHNKANTMVSTLPKHMVVKNNGVQQIIDKIASNGDLEKLSGRMNPKQEQE